MKTVLDTIQGAVITRYFEPATGFELVDFTADSDVDADGSGGNPFHDPYFQPDTALHYPAKPNPAGQPLHAEVVPYVVVPPIVLRGTKGRVLGCRCLVTNLLNGRTVEAVVGDSGPARKCGEMSPAACEAVGLDGNPNHGGTSDFVINYRIHVGQAAVIGGVTYELQRA